MSSDDPFAPPPEAYFVPASGYQAMPPDPRAAAAARPPGVPANPQYDPYEMVGWSAPGGALAVRILAAALAFVVPILPFLAGWFAQETSLRRYQQREYVLATGFVGGGIYDPVLHLSSPETGAVDVVVHRLATVYQGQRVRVLLVPDDPEEYVLWDERARPDIAAWVLAGFTVVAIGLATALVAVHGRRQSRTEGLEGVAARLGDSGPPPPIPARVRLTGTWRTVATAGAGALLTVSAVLLLAAIPGAAPEPDRRTVDGTVTAWGEGLGVSYYDLRRQTLLTRPLSEREAAGKEDLDAMRVTYLVDPYEGYSTFDQAALAGFGGLFLLAGVPLLRRGARGVRSMSRVTRTPPRPVDVVAWARVPGRRPVLMVTTPGETRARRTVAVSLTGAVPLPVALAGRLWVHGGLRPGEWAIVRTPDGGALRPAGPVRGSFGATIRSDPAAPVPPLLVAAPWAPPIWS